jgi:colicin import membrane protein
MTLKNSIAVFLLILFTSLGSGPSYAGNKDKNKSKTTQKVQQLKSSSDDGGDYYNGHKVITGPRGGRYYVNGNGKKVYIKK